MGEAHSASAENDPSLPNFGHSDVLVTWQQSALELETLKWVNNVLKMDSKKQGRKWGDQWVTFKIIWGEMLMA